MIARIRMSLTFYGRSNAEIASGSYEAYENDYEAPYMLYNKQTALGTEDFAMST